MHGNMYQMYKCGFCFLKNRVKFGRMIKSVLFKVCPIACYTFFLTFGQYHGEYHVLLLRAIYRVIFFSFSYEPKRCSASAWSIDVNKCGRCGWCAWVYPRLFALGILKINPLFIPCTMLYGTLLKPLPFVPIEQNVTFFLHFSLRPSFNSCGTHLSVFWIFPISRSRLEIACWLTPNCSANYSCVCVSSSSKNACFEFGAVSNLYSTNCSGAPSVVWKSHFILVYLV